MAKDLVWLESHSFAAWGCSGCAWVMPTSPTVSAKKSAPVRAAFAQHDCKKFLATFHQRTSVRPHVKREFDCSPSPPRMGLSRRPNDGGSRTPSLGPPIMENPI